MHELLNGGLWIAFSGGVFRWLVGHFWNKREQLQKDWDARVEDVTEKISAERFMPAVQKAVQMVHNRRRLSANIDWPLDELLAEEDVSRQLREAKQAALQEEKVHRLFSDYQASCSPVCVTAFLFWVLTSVAWGLILFGEDLPYCEKCYFFVAALLSLLVLGYSIYRHTRRRASFLEGMRI